METQMLVVCMGLCHTTLKQTFGRDDAMISVVLVLHAVRFALCSSRGGGDARQRPSILRAGTTGQIASGDILPPPCLLRERASKGGIIGLHDLSLTTALITVASHRSLKKIEGVAASNNAVNVQACPLTVPKAILKLKSESADAYFQRWAYRRAEQWSKKTKAMVEGWEEQEVYLRRVTAHVQFYAAFLQSDNQKQLGIDHAWAYMSR